MRTSLAVDLFAGIVLLVALAFVTRSWRAALLILPIVFYLGFAALLAPPRVRVVPVRSLSGERAAVGQEVVVRLRILNEGPRIPSLEVFDSIPEGLEVVRGHPHVHVDLRKGGSADIEYTITPRLKGEYAIGPLRLRSREPLGLRYEEVSSGGEARLLVAPRMEDIRRIKIAPRQIRAPMGQVRSRQIGSGLEFYSIRDYVSGDETRHVNWKASARRAELLTNEYEAERSGDTILVLDARGESEVGPVARSTTEIGISATVSLAAKILEGRHRVGLVVQRDMLDTVAPGYGRKQLYRIVDALIHVRPGGEWRLEHVAWVLARFFPRDVQVIIVSPLLDPSAFDAVGDLRARGFDVLVVSPSPLDVERSMGLQDSIGSLAYRVLRMERDARIRALRGHADVVDWNPDVPLAVAMKGVRPYPRRR